MKAVTSGPTIAIALENFDGSKAKEGKILCFIRSNDDSRDSAAIKDLLKTVEAQGRELKAVQAELKKLMKL